MAISGGVVETPDTPTPASSGPPSSEPGGRVRYRRAAMMGLPAFVAGAVLVVLTAQGAIAAQFAISGMPFVITADSLKGTGFGQFGAMDNMPEGSPNAGDTGGQVLTIVTAIRKAQLTNLCQSVEIGGTHLHLTAGGKGTPVQAEGLTTDSTDISGKLAAFDNIEIGGDASTFDKPPVKGPLGVFGQQADTVEIQNVRQENWATTAVKFKLPDLHMNFSSKGC
ncbi:DUF6230 family protein [Streptomyces tsukubensis]|uniref:Cholesterol esterase n=1 Tax=Streptomyces tsukubensis TaxID=83656 RepID=A0A1V4AGI7_9ACTN|nr:DUF6230 family protein [Streptomyces tsukubensis]OON82807.1 cholesterol esterase [Streptomyces tsukubensis]QFR92017.1 cholesterol esterase [Streptomyces tsukubensis]